MALVVGLNVWSISWLIVHCEVSLWFGKWSFSSSCWSSSSFASSQKGQVRTLWHINLNIESKKSLWLWHVLVLGQGWKEEYFCAL